MNHPPVVPVKVQLLSSTPVPQWLVTSVLGDIATTFGAVESVTAQGPGVAGWAEVWCKGRGMVAGRGVVLEEDTLIVLLDGKRPPLPAVCPHRIAVVGVEFFGPDTVTPRLYELKEV